ncbi:MAG: ImmA/IrrE family metallo-endopeptidase [Bauldia sp.]|nr:ImmA/IrrE family metallo-endopeptidase [Bauldia sp.]
MKADDSGLDPDQRRAVEQRARQLLDRAAAWDRLPTPVDDLLEAAKLRTAPISAFDQGVVERYIRQIGSATARILKSAIGKVLGILDVHGRIVHIDPTVNREKQNFLKLHETGHNEIPHQRGLFRWLQDCRHTLDPEVSDLFEREANNFATVVLFQDTRFSAMAADSDFGIKVPLKFGRKFGASAYASIREYVRRNEKACAVIVLEPPEFVPEAGLRASVRRVDASPEFVRRFGSLQLPEAITVGNRLIQCIPGPGKRMSAPADLPLEDRNGQVHEFVGEGFSTPHNVFVLIHARATLRTTIQVKQTGLDTPSVTVGF